MFKLRMIVGVIFLVLGFLLAVSWAPIALLFWDNMNNLPVNIIIILIILGVVFIFAGAIIIAFNIIGRFSSRRGNKVENGILVIGTIVSVKRTGMMINHQPQFDISVKFTTSDGQQITASDKKIVPLIDLSKVQPGAMIPIRYDPSNPQKIMIDNNSNQEDLQDVYDRQMVEKGVISQETLDIVNNGVKAKGVVLSAQATGNIINGMGEMSFHIKVTPPDSGDTFEAFVNKAVPANMLSSTQLGSVIDVYYLSENKDKIAITLNLP